MKNIPLVTVVIPCYNRAEYIQITLNSVFEQTYPNIEIIVIDDGSLDESFEILTSQKHKIRLYQHPGGENRGQSSSINLGLSKACGDYISILDSDDVFASQKIEKQVDYLETNSSIGLVYSNGMNIDSAGKEMYPLYLDGPRDGIGPEEVLESSSFNLPSNAMVRKSVFTKAGFLDESLRSAQDHDMAIRIAEIAPIGYLNEILWFYRRHDASISHLRTLERWKNGFKILNKASKRYPYSRHSRMRRRGVLHFRLAQCYLQKKSYLLAGYHFVMAGLCDPSRGVAIIFGSENVSTPQS